jgi:hypothetical protein
MKFSLPRQALLHGLRGTRTPGACTTPNAATRAGLFARAPCGRTLARTDCSRCAHRRTPLQRRARFGCGRGSLPGCDRAGHAPPARSERIRGCGAGMSRSRKSKRPTEPAGRVYAGPSPPLKFRANPSHGRPARRRSSRASVFPSAASSAGRSMRSTGRASSARSTNKAAPSGRSSRATACASRRVSAQTRGRSSCSSTQVGPQRAPAGDSGGRTAARVAVVERPLAEAQSLERDPTAPAHLYSSAGGNIQIVQYVHCGAMTWRVLRAARLEPRLETPPDQVGRRAILPTRATHAGGRGAKLGFDSGGRVMRRWRVSTPAERQPASTWTSRSTAPRGAIWITWPSRRTT